MAVSASVASWIATVLFAQRPVDDLDASPVALNELGEGIGSLPRFSEVLDALIRPVDEAYERGHGSSRPEPAPDLSLGTHAHSHTESARRLTPC